MKKAIKISAILVALVILATMAFVFTANAAPTIKVATSVSDLQSQLKPSDDNPADGFTVKLDSSNKVIGSETDTTIYNVDGKVTLDLAGNVIKSGSTTHLFEQVAVANPREFVITDSVGGGGIVAPNAYLFGNFTGTVKIEGGTIIVKDMVNHENTKIPSINVSQSKTYKTGTWINVNPTELTHKFGLVRGYAAYDLTDAANANKPKSTVDATEATYYVAPAVYNINYILPELLKNDNPDAAKTTYTIWDEPYSYDTNKATLAATALSKGYEFKGWYLREPGQEDTPFSGITEGFMSYDITLVAKFELKENKITYVGVTAEENNDKNLDSFTVEKANVALFPPEKTGYEFYGWHLTADFSDTPISFIECSTTPHDVTLYANFKPISYNITYFDSYNGTLAPGAVAVDKYTVEDEVILPNKVKPGYTFIGWFTKPYPSEEELKTPVTKIEKGSTEAKTFYAVYTPVQNAITYVVKTEDQSKVKDMAQIDGFDKFYTIETPSFVLQPLAMKDGYTFNGWLDEQGQPITAIDTVTSSGPITVTADISLTQYKVFFDFGVNPDGKPVDFSEVENKDNHNQKQYITVDEGVGLYPASRGDFEFVAWLYKSPVDEAGKPLTGDALTAFIAENGVAYNETTKTWDIPKGYKASTDETAKYTSVTVYAAWKPLEYIINYEKYGYQDQFQRENPNEIYPEGKPILDANGNVIPVDPVVTEKLPKPTYPEVSLVEEPKTYNYSTDLVLPIPEREGYTFIGWFDTDMNKLYTPNAEGKIVIAAGTRKGEINITAKWQVKTYKVAFKYQFNTDYYGVNKEILKKNPAYTDEGKTFREIDFGYVVFGERIYHVVDWNCMNGFYPDWFIYNKMFTKEELKVEVLGNLTGDAALKVSFEPFVEKTEFNVDTGKYTITYHDGSVKEIDFGTVTKLEINDKGILTYVDEKGNKTEISVLTPEDRTALEGSINKLSEDLTKLINEKTGKNADEIAKIQGQIETMLADILKNAGDITALQESVSDIQAQIDELSGKDTTYLVLIIIIGVIAVGSAAGVGFLFFKKH